MKGHAEFPELDKAIDSHANAIAAGQVPVRQWLERPATTHDQFIAKISKGSITEIVKLGRARIGEQHMSKIRFRTDRESLLMVNRWRHENGTWRIADTEDLSGKRSPWSDIEIPAGLRSANGAARGAK